MKEEIDLKDMEEVYYFIDRNNRNSDNYTSLERKTDRFSQEFEELRGLKRYLARTLYFSTYIGSSLLFGIVSPTSERLARYVVSKSFNIGNSPIW